MFRKLIIGVAAVLSFAACNSSSGGGNAPQAESIYGVWTAPEEGGSIILDIREESTVVTMSCTSIGLETSGEIPSRVENNRLEFLTSLKREKRNGDNRCLLNVPQTSLLLKRNGNQLIATMGSEDKTFSYVRHNEYSKPKPKEPNTPSQQPTPTPNESQEAKPSTPSSQNSLYGSWEANFTQDANSSSHAQFDISENSTTLTNTCTYQGQSVSVSVTVNSSVVGNTYKFLSSGKQQQKTTNGDDCAIEIVPSDMSFSINGNTLTLVKASEHEPLVLTRR